MMTRDEFKRKVNNLSCYLRYPILDDLHAIDDHDAEQRQRIDELENGLGCSRSHPHEEMSQVCELKTEIARLKNEMSHWTFVRFKQLEEQNTALREALALLYSVQNGCPLPKYQEDWDRAMALSQQALRRISFAEGS